MIAKIRVRMTTRVQAATVVAAIIAHILLYGTLAFGGDRTPSTISGVCAGLVLAILVIALYIISADKSAILPGSNDERS